MTFIDITSKTKHKVIYYFTDFSPKNFGKAVGQVPAHLRDNFEVNLFDNRDNPSNRKKLREVINDCTHPEIEASYDTSPESLGRFLKEFGIQSPVYIYKVDLEFYAKDPAIATGH